MPKIHIIDDQKSIMNIIGLTLQSYIPECDIITSQDGYEGIELAKKELPDIILLDIMMPRMDGYKACEFLKSYEKTERIPIILMTAIKTKSSDMVKALDTGADSFLTKPINVGELVAKVRILLKIRKVEKELRKKSDKLDELVKIKTCELIESEKKYKTLIEHLGEGVAIVDRDEIFTFSNPASDEIFGVKKGKLIGLNLVNFVDDDNFKILRHQTEERVKNRISNYELLITRPDGKKHYIMITATPLHDMNGNVTGSLIIFRDITKGQKTENVLKEKEKELNAIAEYSLDTIFSISKSGEILYVSKSSKELFGLEPDEIIGTSFTKYIPRGELKNYWNTLKKVLRSKKIRGFQTVITNRKGDIVPVEITGQLVNKKGNLTGQGTIRDITVRKKAEKALKKIEHNYRILFDNLIDGIFVLDAETLKVVIANNAIAKMYGFKSKADAVNINPIDFILPEYKEEALRIITEDMFKKNLHQINEFRSITKDGRIIWISAVGVKTEYQGRLASLISIRDITKRKKAEEQIKIDLKEKNILLQEVHHRVKNNMQVISSMLKLQSAHIKDERALELFKNSQDRVRTMALIHDALYLSKDLTHIDFAGYVKNLTTQIFISHKANSKFIKLNINIKDVLLDINMAIPCGLIINELVSNALKYAFPNKRKGEISISFTYKDQINTLHVKDNGIGISKDIDLKKSTTLGLMLVNSLTKQLNGKLKLEKVKGTSFKITFKKIELKTYGKVQS